ncbi:DUF2493 domain-containing protein [Peribacillus asahii]|uniref:DUF2493 domain-containing protein n=1 Tax=Peribacillus asahii TaxID=228899 RepID=UPI0037F4139B
MKLRVRCIVAGTRTFDNYNLLVRTLGQLFMEKGLFPSDIEIISGGAEGADELGERFADFFKDKGLKLKVMKADWDRQGNSAGYIRNTEMAMYAKSNPDGICVVFWDGLSDGSRNMIKIAEKAGLEVHVIRY